MYAQGGNMNALRQLLASGAITEDDIRQMAAQGGQNALAGMASEQDRFAALPPQEQASADLPMNSLRNENTGKVTYFGPQGGFSDRPLRASPQQAQQMRVAGYGGGIMSDLGMTDQAPAEMDYSRAPVEIAGKGKGFYGKDGNMYIRDGSGQMTKVLSGYDRDASYQQTQRGLALDTARQGLRKVDLDMEHNRARIAQIQEATAASLAQRNQREGLEGMGIPQSLLDKQFGKAPEGLRWTAQGTLEDVPGAAGAKMTEYQSKAQGFGSRAANSHEILNFVGNDGKVQPSLLKRTAETIPFIGGALGMAANKLSSALGGPSDEQQQVEQAQRDFINATLRRESGAVISDTEFDNARLQYFPQPGDLRAVVEQKKKNRELVVDAFADDAGPGKRKVVTSGAKARAVFEAKSAISKGADPVAVRQRLRDNGITDSGI